MAKLPDLSRFELQCLRKLWDRGQATVRDIHGDLDRAPSYSTVKKIVDSHGGLIDVDRASLGGARFTVRLPMVSAMHAHEGQQQ